MVEYKKCKDVVQRSDGGTVEYKTCKGVVQRSDGARIQNM